MRQRHSDVLQGYLDIKSYLKCVPKSKHTIQAQFLFDVWTAL